MNEKLNFQSNSSVYNFQSRLSKNTFNDSSSDSLFFSLSIKHRKQFQIQIAEMFKNKFTIQHCWLALQSSRRKLPIFGGCRLELLELPTGIEIECNAILVMRRTLDVVVYWIEQRFVIIFMIVEKFRKV